MVYFVILIAAYAAAFYYFEPLKHADGMGNDKFKFEIKKAQEMKERLSDVKGIDEINNEI